MHSIMGNVMAVESSSVTHPIEMMDKDVVTKSEQKLLENRYARPKRLSQSVVYEFTREPGLLFQYYQVRERMYSKIWGLSNFSGGEDEIDRRSHILIARKGNLCVGGARMVVRTPRKPLKIPMEMYGVDLVSALPEYNLEYKSYAEISRVAFLDEYANGDCTREVFRHIFRKVVANGIHYVFTMAPAIQIRANRKNAQAIGVESILLDQVKIPEHPEFEGIRMFAQVFPNKEVYKDLFTREELLAEVE